jgi:hypothetical protein
VLRHCLWSFGPCILSWPTRVATRGSWPPQTPLIQPPPPPLGVGFCLVHFCQEQDAVLRLWNPTRELNQLLSVIWLLLRALACVLRFAGKSKPSWRGQSSSSSADNQRIRGAKVAGFISLDLKPDRCVSNPPKSIVI